MKPGRTGLKQVARSVDSHLRVGGISDRTRTHIMALTRQANIDPQLAHSIRVRVNAGVTADQAERFITLLRQLPASQTPKQIGN
jgi:hypothetical protein